MAFEIRVRQATARDAAALADLYIQNHDFQRRAVPQRLKPTSDAWRRAGLPEAIAGLLNREDVGLYVAESDAEIIGLVDIYDRTDYEVEGRPARRFAEVQNLVVAERQRRRGVGNRLMDAAESWAKGRNIPEVELHTWEFPEGPLGFYKRRGYSTIERTLRLSLGRDSD